MLLKIPEDQSQCFFIKEFPSVLIQKLSSIRKPAHPLNVPPFSGIFNLDSYFLYMCFLGSNERQKKAKSTASKFFKRRTIYMYICTFDYLYIQGVDHMRMVFKLNFVRTSQAIPMKLSISIYKYLLVYTQKLKSFKYRLPTI